MNRRYLLISSAGAYITATLPSAAQQKAMPVIGFLGCGLPGPYAPQVAAFHQG